MAVIEIEHLSKTYFRDFIDIEHGRLKLRFKDRKIEALKDLTMEIEEGEIFGLLGPNGAGKTTAIKILMGIQFPTGGTARFASALCATDFLRSTSMISYTRNALAEAAGDVRMMADREGLTAHRASVDIRLPDEAS